MIRTRDTQRYTQGFTLVEVLIALAIFSVIALLSYQAINTLVSTENQSRKTLAALTELQQAFMLFERDIRQLSPRPINDVSGQIQPALVIVSATQLEFSTQHYHDWSNKTAHRVQRVRYRFNDGQLIREAWAYPDYLTSTPPQSIVLLSDLRQLSFEEIVSVVNQNKTNSKNQGILAYSNAISLIIEHRQFGRVMRTVVPYPD